jgi:Cysteine-rich secretory protein family
MIMPVNMNDPRLQTALAHLNKYRAQVGAKPVRLNETLIKVAQGHADYFALNAPLPDPHGQTPDKPGFTGVRFAERGKAAGYPNWESLNENVSFLADPLASINWFMATLNHRTPMTDPLYDEVGFGFATRPDNKAITVIDLAPSVWKEVFDTAWIIYPPDGGSNIALRFDGESPNPLAAFGARFPVGNPVTVQYRGAGEIVFEGNAFSLTDQTGTPVAIYPIPKPSMFANRKSAAIVPQKPLQPDTTYTVSFRYRIGNGSPQMKTWSFSTGGTLTTANLLKVKPGLPTPDSAIYKLWNTADAPVAGGRVQRTWLYGPEVFHLRQEPYAEAPNGQRPVYYFDKARMEITNPAADRASQWFISTGLLAREMILGQIQVGNSVFENRVPAQVPVAGDDAQINQDAPTYATFNTVASLNNDRRAPDRTGQPLNESILKSGQISILPNLPAPLKYHFYENKLGHNVPDVFMRWLEKLPNPWLFMLGLPLSEAYWAKVKVGGIEKDVLIQVFERRTLTYTPTNDPVWQVEMGNVGLHYFRWRYQ